MFDDRLLESEWIANNTSNLPLTWWHPKPSLKVAPVVLGGCRIRALPRLVGLRFRLVEDLAELMKHRIL